MQSVYDWKCYRIKITKEFVVSARKNPLNDDLFSPKGPLALAVTTQWDHSYVKFANLEPAFNNDLYKLGSTGGKRLQAHRTHLSGVQARFGLCISNTVVAAFGSTV